MKVTYWISTGLISAFLLWSAWSYLCSKNTIEGVRELGFPDHFRLQLAVLKIAGAIVLLLPLSPPILREAAYAGVAFFFLTAVVAHIAHQDSPAITVVLLVLMGLLATSRYTWEK